MRLVWPREDNDALDVYDVSWNEESVSYLTEERKERNRRNKRERIATFFLYMYFFFFKSIPIVIHIGLCLDCN